MYEVDRMWIVRKILSKLQRCERVHIVDLFGGVTDYSQRSSYKYVDKCPMLRRSPEIVAFRIAKELEKKKLLRVEYVDGRNVLVKMDWGKLRFSDFWREVSGGGRQV